MESTMRFNEAFTLTLTIFAIYDNVHNLRLNDIYLEWHDLDDIISAI